MNYWPAEVTNLSELHEPLFRMLREVSQTGAIAAQKMYRHRGWVVHHNTTIWRDAFPVDGEARAAFWNMAPGWFSSHLWERWLFTGDKKFLADDAYPLMKGAAEFYADWLVDAGDGELVTPVSTSPENKFIDPSGRAAAVCVGVTMDLAIIRELFTRTIEAAELLGRDAELVKELRGKLAKLAPYRIGAKGQLQEWREDYAEEDPRQVGRALPSRGTGHRRSCRSASSGYRARDCPAARPAPRRCRRGSRRSTATLRSRTCRGPPSR